MLHLSKPKSKWAWKYQDMSGYIRHESLGWLPHAMTDVATAFLCITVLFFLVFLLVVFTFKSSCCIWAIKLSPPLCWHLLLRHLQFLGTQGMSKQAPEVFPGLQRVPSMLSRRTVVMHAQPKPILWIWSGARHSGEGTLAKFLLDGVHAADSIQWCCMIWIWEQLPLRIVMSGSFETCFKPHRKSSDGLSVNGSPGASWFGSCPDTFRD